MSDWDSGKIWLRSGNKSKYIISMGPISRKKGSTSGTLQYSIRQVSLYY